jgi:hypothetical protein
MSRQDANKKGVNKMQLANRTNGEEKAVRINKENANEVIIEYSNGVTVTKPFPPLGVVIDALFDSKRFGCETLCDFVSVIYDVAKKYHPNQKKRGEIIAIHDFL